MLPRALTSAFNLKADRTGGGAGFGGLCHLPYYVVAADNMSSFFAMKLDMAMRPPPLILFLFFRSHFTGTQLASTIG
jgi:hypothetical protein